MLKCNLAVLLAERGLKISKVSQDTKISRTTLTALTTNRSQGIQLETLDSLCKYLHITPKDFFCFTPYSFYVRAENLLKDVIGSNFDLEIQITFGTSSSYVFLSGHTDERFEDSIKISFYDIDATVDEDDPNGNANAIARFIKPLNPIFQSSLRFEIIDAVLDLIEKNDYKVDVDWPEGLFS